MNALGTGGDVHNGGPHKRGQGGYTRLGGDATRESNLGGLLQRFGGTLVI